MNLKGLLILTGTTLCGLAVLIGLGTWQLQRKAWKDALIGQLREQTGRVPAAYSSWLTRKKPAAREAGENPIAADLFAPVVIRGAFRHADEIYVFTTRRGRPGYLVLTPFKWRNAKAVWINRGFVPEALREPHTRRSSLLQGDVEVQGIIRAPESVGWFSPAPDRAKRIWYTIDLAAITKSVKIDVETTHFIEADRTPNPGGWPRGQDAKEFIRAIPNKHFGYALTWFGLAAGLCIVYGFFVRSQLRESAADR